VPFEWLLIAVVSALGLWLLGPRRVHAGLLVVAMLGGGALAGLASSARAPPPPLPISVGRAGFTGSNACRSCHPAEHASWHASYHRSMTQRATLAAVASPALRAGERLRVEVDGRKLELFSRGEQLWASVPDPSLTAGLAAADYDRAFAASPLRDVPVQLLTGSHRHQAFWVKAVRQGELRALPVVYVIDEARLVPRREAFLNPPDAPEPNVRWNSNCVQCHAVAGAPGHDERRDVFETTSAELGIACEACHGAGAAHVRSMQNPLTRYLARGSRAGQPNVVDPRKLTSERASQVCGRCHSYFFPKRESEWWVNGFANSYKPGDDLSRAQLLLSRELLAEPDAPQLGASAESLFYADGSIRVGGREYNGMQSSACFERGRASRKLSCLSCHSLHRGAPDDQLDPDKLGNRACTQCHAAQGSNPSAHSHHAPASPGSLCYNCHMPHVSYALLGAIRSHRVDAPAFDTRTRDKPNACSLCHLEQSEAWAARHAAAWFGDKPRFQLERAPELAAADTPSGAVFALAGDAAVRAVVAAALGRHQSSSEAPELRAQLLEQLAHDDYAAVRHVAERSLASASQAAGAPPLSSATVERLLAARDRRPVTIAE
jgi:hypothetical protein